MTLWKVGKYYHNGNTPNFDVVSYNSKDYLICCWKWYGINGLRWCYLSKKQAECKAKKLNKRYIK